MSEHDSEQPGTGTRSGTGTEVYFEHERLDVFRVARAFKVLATRLMARRVPAHLRAQFESATDSILSNIAEGAGRTAKADKQRFYEIARGSTTEVAAHLDILHIKQIITDAELHEARTLLVRVAMMLIRM